jgi:ankyrin repeat protein
VIDLSFHNAVKNNNLAELQNLIRKRDDFQIEAKDVAGQTILHVACEEGNLDMVQFLVDKLKANVNAKDKEDWTPLHIACHRGALEVVDFLLDRLVASFSPLPLSHPSLLSFFYFHIFYFQ